MDFEAQGWLPKKIWYKIAGCGKSMEILCFLMDFLASGLSWFLAFGSMRFTHSTSIESTWYLTKRWNNTLHCHCCCPHAHGLPNNSYSWGNVFLLRSRWLILPFSISRWDLKTSHAECLLRLRQDLRLSWTPEDFGAPVAHQDSTKHSCVVGLEVDKNVILVSKDWWNHP